jgi:hypothetical protein
MFLERLAPGAIWRLIDTQPRLDGDALRDLGVAEKAEPTGLAAACARAGRFASSPRSLLEGYVSVSRSEIRARSDEHLRNAAEVQFQLMSVQGSYRSKAAELKQKLGRNDGPTSPRP